jgi:GTPase SAR1 family protein
MSAFVSLFKAFLGRKNPSNIMCFGLPNAGKTTMLFQMRIGETKFSTLQDGTQITIKKEQNLTITAYPISSDGDTSPLLQDIFKSAHALMFVCDSADIEQLKKVKGELHRLLKITQTREVPLLVCANKADLPGALDDKQCADELGLHDIRNRFWKVQQTCATSGDGVYEGMLWIADEIKKIKQ